MMQMTAASRRPMRGRKPKTKEEGRVCSVDDCETVLSRYNRKEVCFAHAPLRYPRVRGREVVA